MPWADVLTDPNGLRLTSKIPPWKRGRGPDDSTLCQFWQGGRLRDARGKARVSRAAGPPDGSQSTEADSNPNLNLL